MLHCQFSLDVTAHIVSTSLLYPLTHRFPSAEYNRDNRQKTDTANMHMYESFYSVCVQRVTSAGSQQPSGAVTSWPLLLVITYLVQDEQNTNEERRRSCSFRTHTQNTHMRRHSEAELTPANMHADRQRGGEESRHEGR